MNKRFFSLVFVLALVVAILIPANTVEASNTYKVKVGKRIRLVTTLEKAVWGSSDVSVAIVSKKGVVKGKSKGKCYISAVADGKAEVFTVYVKASGSKKSTADEVTFEGKQYKLAFSDDFETLDNSRWAYCPEMERQDAGGVWRNSCSKVEEGNFVIACSVAEDGTPISGGIRSTGAYEQTFGLYHIRFKMDKADGLWYAFWLLSDNMEEPIPGNGATDGAELDIIELVPFTTELCMSVHWDGYGPDLKSCCEITHVKDDSFYDSYHELWYVWDKNGYRLYLDGTDENSRIFDFPGDKYGDGACMVPCDLIISAEFGTWGGDVDRSQLPAHFYVDYVQVYKELLGD